jgi:putative spermidine/putrescine transport system substrate-binding protein
MKPRAAALTVLVILALVLALTAPTPVPAQRPLDGTTVRVATWGGSWRDAIHQLVGTKLEAQGAKMEYVLANPSENFAKLVAARGREAPFDVMEVTPEILTTMTREGFVQKLDLTKIPAAKSLPKFAVGDQWVITTIAEEGIAYNEKKFQELGLPKPQRYSDLAHPKLEGHVAFPDVTVTMHWSAVVALARENGGSETAMDKALDVVKKIKPLYYYPSSTDLVTKINLGDVWAAPFHAGWVIRVKRTGFPLAHVNVTLGGKTGYLNPIYMLVPRGAKNVPGAEAFMEVFLSPEVQFEFAKKVGVVPVHRGARDRLAKDPEAAILMLTDEQLNQANMVDWSKVNADEWRDKWNRFVGR